MSTNAPRGIGTHKPLSEEFAGVRFPAPPPSSAADQQTPAQRMGLKVGDRVVNVTSWGLIPAGLRGSFHADDGTSNPWFLWDSQIKGYGTKWCCMLTQLRPLTPEELAEERGEVVLTRRSRKEWLLYVLKQTTAAIEAGKYSTSTLPMLKASLELPPEEEGEIQPTTPEPAKPEPPTLYGLLRSTAVALIQTGDPSDEALAIQLLARARGER